MTTTTPPSAMLPAWSLTFKELYPFGATVHDARGRRLLGVMACNPVSGEVVMLDWRPLPWNRLVRYSRRHYRWQWWRWLIPMGLPARHGFWPAPLTIAPIVPEAE